MKSEMNCVARNAISGAVVNTPVDIPMGSGSHDIIVDMEEFTTIYGLRKAPRPLKTTFDKLDSYLARWGISHLKTAIVSSILSGREYATKVKVDINFAFRP